MRIALELQPCCGNRTGIGTYTYELAKRLHSQDGIEFHGELFNFCGRHNHSELFRQLKIPVNESRIFPYGVYRRAWNRLPIDYDQLFPQPADLHIFFNYIIPPRVKGRVIDTIYDCTHLRFPETMDDRNRRRLAEGLERSIERSDHFLTISEFSRREMTELLHIPAERISVVYSAPSDLSRSADFSETAVHLGIKSPFILYVGTIEPRKNLLLLLRAFALLKSEAGIPHQLVLAGGTGWNNTEIYKTAQALPCAEDICFTGYLSEAERNSLYQNADVLTFPSLYEGFGMPPLEAMRLGCPVVCSDAAALPEITGGAAHLVNPAQEESIAEGIWKVLSNRGYAADLTQKGHLQAQKFTWESSANRLVQICRAVLEGA